MAVHDEAQHRRAVLGDEVDHNRVSVPLFHIINLQTRIAPRRESVIKMTLHVIRRQIEIALPPYSIPDLLVECRGHVIAFGPCP